MRILKEPVAHNFTNFGLLFHIGKLSIRCALLSRTVGRNSRILAISRDICAFTRGRNPSPVETAARLFLTRRLVKLMRKHTGQIYVVFNLFCFPA